MLPSFSSFLMLLGMSPAMEASCRPASPSGTEVAVEVRILRVADPLPVFLAENADAKAMTSRHFLSDREMVSFLERAQGDRRTEVIQAPRLIVASGKRAAMEIIEWPRRNGQAETGRVFNGTRFSIVPTADEARSRIDVEFDLEMREDPQFGWLISMPDGTLSEQKVPSRTEKVSTRISIPSGETLLLVGGLLEQEERREYTPPVIGKVPYLNRLFKTVSYSKWQMRTYILVTPRIQNAEAAANFTLAAKPQAAPNELLPESLQLFELPKGDICLTGHTMPGTVATKENTPGNRGVRPVLDVNMLGTPGLKYDVKVSQMSLGATFPMPWDDVAVKGVLPERVSDPLSIWPKPWLAMARPATSVGGDEPAVATAKTESAPPACCGGVIPAAHIRGSGTTTLTVADIETLHKEGVSEQVIINQIRVTGSTFSLSIADLVRLTKAGVGEAVITTMQNARPKMFPLPAIEIEVGGNQSNACDSDPKERMRQLLNASEQFRQIRDDKSRFWFTNEPSTLTYDRLSGAIGP